MVGPRTGWQPWRPTGVLGAGPRPIALLGPELAVPTTFSVALFRSARDRWPKRLAAPWPLLALMLSAPWRYRAKLQAPAWSPALYAANAQRGRAGVVSVSCLVFDYDDGTAIAAAREPWMDHPHFVHTSWSHTHELPKFRVVLPLQRAVPSSAWLKSWRYAAAQAKGQVDPKCKDPSRLYFLPAVRDERTPFEFIEHDPGGSLLELDWESIPEPTPPRPPRRAPSRTACTDSQRDAARAHRLRTDPETRRRAGAELGGREQGQGTSERVTRVTCPGCGRRTVYWFVSPERMTGAACNHLNSCGWRGPILSLLTGAS